MEIYLVRHGSTEWNRIKKIQGQSDIPLDETGLAMAHQSGLALLKEGIKFDFVFASPLTRAYITAKEFLCGDTSKIVNRRPPKGTELWRLRRSHFRRMRHPSRLHF